MSHARRKFYDAAAAKDPIAREALFRLRMLFQNEDEWRDLPRQKSVRGSASRNPQAPCWMTSFRGPWGPQYDLVKDQRGLLRTAFGYAIRHKDALCRFLEDGRLPALTTTPASVPLEAWPSGEPIGFSAGGAATTMPKPPWPQHLLARGFLQVARARPRGLSHRHDPRLRRLAA